MNRMPVRVFTILALALAVGLATAVSPYASPQPDGLERVAGDTGFLEEGGLHAVQEDAPVPDYAFPGIADERVATGVAGFVGTLGIFLVGCGIAWGLRRARGAEGATAP
jgi:hypothetical protein